MERTLVLLKPGCLQRRIVGEVLSRFERKGLKLVALKLIKLDGATAEAHYAEHREKPFFGSLVEYTLSGPIVALILEGNEAISVVRRLAGLTKLQDALPGTIRGDYAAQTQLNIVHASDSPASSERECALFFKPGEIFPWEDGNQAWF
jgi:nucleoside-diphosphate kinase